MSIGINSRETVLRRVRALTGGVSTKKAVQEGWDAIPRRYKREGSREQGFLLELLEERLRDYDVAVYRAERSDVVNIVARILSERGKQKIVMPLGLPTDWLPRGFEFVVDDGLTVAMLDDFDGAITGSSVAIAETGTIVLQASAAQARRGIMLLPDYHLCLVRVEDVVETVPEAMKRLRETADLATTFVSGPSATADIEMTRIKGVHGPRNLDVILLT
jgi:L-lactate dehydrogenase complex protein LldG